MPCGYGVTAIFDFSPVDVFVQLDTIVSESFRSFFFTFVRSDIKNSPNTRGLACEALTIYTKTFQV